jgi:hypothetical protein
LILRGNQIFSTDERNRFKNDISSHIPNPLLMYLETMSLKH